MPEDKDPNERRHERTEGVEEIVQDFEDRLEDHKFPVTSEELAVEYGDQPIDLPNETENLGDVFDRLGQEFESPQAVREAVYNELTGEAAGPEEYNDEREIRELDEAVSEEEPMDKP